ncbi:pyridine nucleotide-disulfide oxidoreductase [Orenia metallireducens]|uniref:Pyridine nucleotide-disulfide oxidoreductase n=1 Tax=Orenia metallireducens TaxID=1413210 RepID=A0A1C0A768_9FIRM|nr:FAD-dependent oxidoreductase [Orenia metallireducens]OCL26099.1 pyridine nucleotide-disulfide oxidoreductase [Orenia metallireducens]
MTTKIVVIGAVAAGASAATKARREDEHAEIILFEKGPYASFANCGLPYYIGGTIRERKNLFQVSNEYFHKRFNIDLRVNHEVIKINRKEKNVEVVNHQTGESFNEEYDKLIVAVGGEVIKPPIEGVDSQKIFTLLTVPDADEIREELQNEPESVVIVGGGYIGVETAEELHHRGLKVILVEMMDQIIAPLDKEMTMPLVQHLKELGIEIILSDGVRKFQEEGDMIKVTLQSEREFDADFVILATGVRPRLKLVKDAGLKVSEIGVVVNEFMQTSDPNIYAAGDIVESTHLVTGEKVRFALAGPANKQGRIAGAHAAGKTKKKFKGVLGTSIVKVGDFTAASTGLNEKECQKRNISYYSVYLDKGDHAGYYPGSEDLTIKLLVEEETGKLLGAQCIGRKSVDKQIDVFATALQAKMTVEDLEDLDLAYAPPYSSAKGPVIMSGMIASNHLRYETDLISPQDLKSALEAEKDIQLVDVRTDREYEEGYIGGAKHIPLNSLRERIGELNPEKYTVVYCRKGYRGYLAYKILIANGFDTVENLTGGILAWNRFSKDKELLIQDL